MDFPADRKNTKTEVELSVILPCRNEEKSLDFCLKKIKRVLTANRINAEIIVSDSSIDTSPDIARRNNVILLKHNKEGYGIAYLEAFKIVKGKFIFMADSDCSYDFNEIPKFLELLRSGQKFIIGNRFGGNIQKTAMPWHHRYIGNPILSLLLRTFFRQKVKDTHSGMRAIDKKTLDLLDLQTAGMEFASEMIIKAAKSNIEITETPIDYYARKGESKMKSFSDGWRHLRFMLLYCPLYLFFIPGLFLFCTGTATLTILYFNQLSAFGRHFYIHPMFFSGAIIILGYQLIIFSFFAKSYAVNNLGEKNDFLAKFYKYFTIERAGILGVIIGGIGLLIYIYITVKWLSIGMGQLNEEKNALLGLIFFILGIQTFFSAFMLSILGIKKAKR